MAKGNGRKNDELLESPSNEPAPQPETAEQAPSNAISIKVLEEFCTPEPMANGFLGLKVRECTNADRERSVYGVKLQTNQQLIVKTGIFFQPSLNYRVVLSPCTEWLINNEVVVWPYPVAIDGEICIFLYCFGRAVMVKRGDTVAMMCIERREVYPVKLEVLPKAS